jgi:hypothetical protein
MEDRMEKAWFRCFWAVAAVACYGASSISAAAAQGVTSAGMSGIVIDESGAGLAGAQVIAIHEPSGTRASTLTREDGRFNLRNLRVGGPFTVTATYLGYSEEQESGIALELGQDRHLTFVLMAQAIALDEIRVVGDSRAVFSPGRTGAGTLRAWIGRRWRSCRRCWCGSPRPCRLPKRRFRGGTA